MSDKLIGIGIGLGALAILFVAYNSMKRNDELLAQQIHGYNYWR